MLTIKQTITGSPRQVVTEFRASMRAGLFQTGEFWHHRIMPGHFEFSAIARYDYQPRAVGYCRAKARAKHHQRPLEWSGRLKAQVRQSGRITATAKSVRVTMVGPKWLNMYRPEYGQPYKYGELVKTLESESGQMSQMLDQFVTRRLNELKTPDYGPLGNFAGC